MDRLYTTNISPADALWTLIQGQTQSVKDALYQRMKEANNQRLTLNNGRESCEYQNQKSTAERIQMGRSADDYVFPAVPDLLGRFDILQNEHGKLSVSPHVPTQSADPGGLHQPVHQLSGVLHLL